MAQRGQGEDIECTVGRFEYNKHDGTRVDKPLDATVRFRRLQVVDSLIAITVIGPATNQRDSRAGGHQAVGLAVGDTQVVAVLVTVVTRGVVLQGSV